LSLGRAQKDFPTDGVVVVWDRPEPTFRHKMDPTYKANREKLDENLKEQFPWLREMVEILGLPSMDREGYEADDLMASMAAQGPGQDIEVLLYSSDKDLAQVVGEHVWQCPPPKPNEPKRKMGPSEVKEKFGVPPEQMRDWQALVGDSSDNIPGVKGVGPKRATTLLEKYGDLETVLERGPAEEKGKLAENLKEFVDDALRSQILVTLITDMELPPLQSLQAKKPVDEEVQAFFLDHGLRSHLQRMEPEAPKNKKIKAPTLSSPPSMGGLFPEEVIHDPNKNYRLVQTTEDLQQLCAALSKVEIFAVDTETTSINPMLAKMVGMSFAIEANAAWYVPVQVEGALDALQPILENPDIGKIGQNIKYDLHIFRRHGIQVQGVQFDTMLAHFLLEPNERHNLDSLSRTFLGIEKIPTKQLLGTGKNALTMDLVPVAEVSNYACEDADCTWQLAQPFEKSIREINAEKLLFEIEIPLMEVLCRMEAEGIRIDEGKLREMSVKLQKRIAELEDQAHQLAGMAFNLKSPKQLGPILFEALRIQEEAGIKRVGKTKTGYKTDAATLEKYIGIPIVDCLLEHRRLSKLLGTYVTALPQCIHPETGRIHTSFNQAVASTGRLSSSNPNLQNIPIRTSEGRAIREVFIPRKDGWALLAADYSQVELRIVAHLSQDPALLAAFRDGADIHARTAALIFKVPQEEVTPEMRSSSKAINFGILYGMGPQRLSREIKVSLQEAKDFIEQYFEALPGVRQWLDRTLESAEETGEVRTLFGRRRPIPDLQSSDGRVRANAENIAVNSPVQGSAADIIKKAMIQIDARLRAENFQAKMILQVHDELVFDCPKEEKRELEALVLWEMENAFALDVPLKVDLGWGAHWGEAH
ncbi:MAG: DNA polymerase I, partial [Planctomycetota bacterium]|nr:DNA polymerase I [Planctomycetota bacterium]